MEMGDIMMLPQRNALYMKLIFMRYINFYVSVCVYNKQLFEDLVIRH